MTLKPPFFDLSQAREISGEKDMLRQLVLTFIESLDTELANAQQAFQTHDQPAMSQSLHALKGFLPLFCQPELAQMVIALYAECRRQELSKTQARFQTLEPALLELQKEAKAWLGAL